MTTPEQRQQINNSHCGSARRAVLVAVRPFYPQPNSTKMTTKDTLLEQAKRYVTRAEEHGGDYQQAVWDIISNRYLDPLLEGLSDQEREDLEKEISSGV